MPGSGNQRDVPNNLEVQLHALEECGIRTAAALVHELMEARDERRLLNL